MSDPMAYVMACIHKVFFSWWLDKRLVRHNDKIFGERITESLEFLFTDYGAQLVPPNDRGPQPYFDWAQATVVSGDVQFNFTHDRGKIIVTVAPKHAPKDWQYLPSVLRAIAVGDTALEEIEFAEFARLPTIARELEPRMALLKIALSPEHFEQTKAAVSNILNRRLATFRLQSEIQKRKRKLGLPK